MIGLLDFSLRQGSQLAGPGSPRFLLRSDLLGLGLLRLLIGACLFRFGYLTLLRFGRGGRLGFGLARHRNCLRSAAHHYFRRPCVGCGHGSLASTCLVLLSRVCPDEEGYSDCGCYEDQGQGHCHALIATAQPAGGAGFAFRP